MEPKDNICNYQSGFRKGMDPTVCLEHEIWRAQANKESVAALFDIKKAYDMMWKEGLNIKVRKAGDKGKIRWIKGVLFERSIQVKIGKHFSEINVENGTTQIFIYHN